MKKILFYGASVTAQNGESGYVQSVCFNDFYVEKIGIGACHLNDAGFYMLSAVLEASPKVCVLEWCTTGCDFVEKYKINMILSEMKKCDIFPVFLILPRVGVNINFNRPIEETFIQLSKDFNIPLIDLRSDFAVSFLRDDVHTNIDGAKYYALKIVNSLRDIVSKTEFSWSNYQLCTESFRDVTFDINLSVSCDSVTFKLLKNTDNAEVVIHTIFGPRSPILDVIVNGCFLKSICMFDAWCYYERKMFIQILVDQDLINFPLGELIEVELKVSEVLPDYTVAKEKLSNRDAPIITLNNIMGCNVLIEDIEVC